MIVELVHNSHMVGDEPRKIVNTFNITDINQFSYTINEVNEEFCTIVFTINNGESDSEYYIPIEGKSVDYLRGDCRLIYTKIFQLLENNDRTTNLIIFYQYGKLTMLEWNIKEIQL